MTARFRRCVRCRRRLRNLVAAESWNVVTERGIITEVICPDCQTPEENAQAAINEATLDYKVDVAGRFYGVPKVLRHG